MPKVSYFLGKIGLVFVAYAAQVTLLILIGVAVLRHRAAERQSSGSPSPGSSVLGLVSCTLLGIAFSVVPKNAKGASAVVSPIVLVLQFTSGVFFLFQNLPDVDAAVRVALPAQVADPGDAQRVPARQRRSPRGDRLVRARASAPPCSSPGRSAGSCSAWSSSAGTSGARTDRDGRHRGARLRRADPRRLARALRCHGRRDGGADGAATATRRSSCRCWSCWSRRTCSCGSRARGARRCARSVAVPRDRLRGHRADDVPRPGVARDPVRALPARLRAARTARRDRRDGRVTLDVHAHPRRARRLQPRGACCSTASRPWATSSSPSSIGLFIDGIVRESRGRKELLEQLQAAQGELAALEREAGARGRARAAGPRHPRHAGPGLHEHRDAVAGRRDGRGRRADAEAAARLAPDPGDRARGARRGARPGRRDDAAGARGRRAARRARPARRPVRPRHRRRRRRFTVEGEAGPLSATSDVVALRATQEALANVRKHAGATRVDVVLTYDEDGATCR